MLKLITNGTVYTPRQRIQNGSVLLDDKRVVAVGGRSAMAVPPEAVVVDAGSPSHPLAGYAVTQGRSDCR